MARPTWLPAGLSRWLDRALTLAALVVVVVTLGRYVLPRGADALGEAALSPALPPGKVALVELGATYCPSCIASKPIMAALARTYGDRAEIRVIDVDRPEHRAEAQRLGAIAQLRYTPTFLITDRQGRAVAKFVGPTSYAALSRALDDALSPRAEAP